MKVLAAEDNVESRYLLVKILQAYGHEVTAVANGAEALQQALKEAPDILVTDILMPEMDGYQLCHEWMQHDRLKDIPFVFYTATYTTEEDEKFALSLGASTFIRKPTEPDAFIRILEEVFEKAKSGLLVPPEVAPLEPSLYLTEYNKRIVAKLDEKVAQLEEAEGKLRHANSVLKAIKNINQMIVREKDSAKILQGACEMLIETKGYKFAWIGLIEEGHKRVLPAAKDGVEEDYLNSLKITWDDSETGKGPTGAAIKTRHPSIMNNIPEDPRYQPWREEALKWGYLSSAAIPLAHDEKVYGALNVYSSLKDAFNDEEVQLLIAISGDIAFALKAIYTEEEHKRAEDALRASEEKYRTLFENATDGVFTLDLKGRVTSGNKRAEEICGYKREEMIGKHFINLLPKKELPRMFNTFQKVLRGKVGVFETELKTKSGGLVPLEVTTAASRKGGKIIGTMGMVRDITERKKAEEQLEHSFVDLAETVSRAMESRDPYTSGHQRRVAELARLVGEKMKLDNNKLMGLYIGGLLHDAGKISIPESILSKPGRLTEEEWALVRAHAKRGYDILKDTKLPWPVAEMALHHHERMDGSGYPDGISGDKLSLENRILGVCDVAEAMSSFRPYRPAKDIAEVLKELRSGRGTKYDADVVDVMLELIESGEFVFNGV